MDSSSGPTVSSVGTKILKMSAKTRIQEKLNLINTKTDNVANSSEKNAIGMPTTDSSNQKNSEGNNAGDLKDVETKPKNQIKIPESFSLNERFLETMGLSSKPLTSGADPNQISELETFNRINRILRRLSSQLLGIGVRLRAAQQLDHNQLMSVFDVVALMVDHDHIVCALETVLDEYLENSLLERKEILLSTLRFTNKVLTYLSNISVGSKILHHFAQHIKHRTTSGHNILQALLKTCQTSEGSGPGALTLMVEQLLQFISAEKDGCQLVGEYFYPDVPCEQIRRTVENVLELPISGKDSLMIKEMAGRYCLLRLAMVNAKGETDVAQLCLSNDPDKKLTRTIFPVKDAKTLLTNHGQGSFVNVHIVKVFGSGHFLAYIEPDWKSDLANLEASLVQALPAAAKIKSVNLKPGSIVLVARDSIISLNFEVINFKVARAIVLKPKDFYGEIELYLPDYGSKAKAKAADLKEGTEKAIYSSPIITVCRMQGVSSAPNTEVMHESLHLMQQLATPEAAYTLLMRPTFPTLATLTQLIYTNDKIIKHTSLEILLTLCSSRKSHPFLFRSRIPSSPPIAITVVCRMILRLLQQDLKSLKVDDTELCIKVLHTILDTVKPEHMREILTNPVNIKILQIASVSSEECKRLVTNLLRMPNVGNSYSTATNNRSSSHRRRDNRRHVGGKVRAPSGVEEMKRPVNKHSTESWTNLHETINRSQKGDENGFENSAEAGRKLLNQFTKQPTNVPSKNKPVFAIADANLTDSDDDMPQAVPQEGKINGKNTANKDNSYPIEKRLKDCLKNDLNSVREAKISSNSKQKVSQIDSVSRLLQESLLLDANNEGEIIGTHSIDSQQSLKEVPDDETKVAEQVKVDPPERSQKEVHHQLNMSKSMADISPSDMKGDTNESIKSYIAMHHDNNAGENKQAGRMDATESADHVDPRKEPRVLSVSKPNEKKVENKSIAAFPCGFAVTDRRGAKVEFISQLSLNLEFAGFLAITISAMLNTNGGKVLIGVEGIGIIRGVHLTCADKDELLKLVDTISGRLIYPRVGSHLVDVCFHPILDSFGKSARKDMYLVRISVEAQSKMVYLVQNVPEVDGGVYKRRRRGPPYSYRISNQEAMDLLDEKEAQET